MIVDAHTHRYPDEVTANPTAFARRTMEPIWLQMVAPSKQPSLQGWSDRKTMLQDMDDAGVQSCLLLGWYWENAVLVSRRTSGINNGWGKTPIVSSLSFR